MHLDEGSIGPYRIVRRIGYGRSSEVLLATRSFPGNFDRRVVIKRLLAKQEAEADRQAVLANEALAYARVAHPAIVQLFDFFEHEGHLVLVLEYVDGLPLSRLLGSLRLHRRSLGDRVSYFIASRLFAALAAAHSARDPRSGEATPVIHRDVNPDNVLIPWDGFVKLGDFDLAKVVGVSGDTRAGLMKGTYGYMAPEQVLGDPVTPRTDVYAACLVLRELLLSKRTFDEDLPELELLRAMEQSRLAPIESTRGGISRRLADAMRRGLVRDPAQRTLTPAEMVDVLRSETDMEAAHIELTGILTRHRPTETRGGAAQLALTPPAGLPSAASQLSYETPRAMTISQAESVPPIEPVPSSMRPSAWLASGHVRTLGLAAAAGGAIAFVAVSLGFFSPSAPDDVSAGTSASSESTPVVLPSAPTSPSAAPVAASPPLLASPVASTLAPPTLSKNVALDAAAPVPLHSAESSPAPALTTGELVTPASGHGHRVWVDGHVAAWSSGATLRVPCGTHVVRVGSTGASRTVVVPCGGQVTVQ